MQSLELLGRLLVRGTLVRLATAAPGTQLAHVNRRGSAAAWGGSGVGRWLGVGSGVGSAVGEMVWIGKPVSLP